MSWCKAPFEAMQGNSSGIAEWCCPEVKGACAGHVLSGDAGPSSSVERGIDCVTEVDLRRPRCGTE